MVLNMPLLCHRVLNVSHLNLITHTGLTATLLLVLFSQVFCVALAFEL